MIILGNARLVTELRHHVFVEHARGALERVVLALSALWLVSPLLAGQAFKF